ncbi:MAG: hypothetical protein HY702_08410 [Gemmatimonadetes bacterium]|nr:hypothetical protein [Gemmatimonadota bacterium]
MSRDRDEDDIRRRFLELREADERRARPFAADWEAALSRMAGARRRVAIRRLAAAGALVGVAAALAAILFVKPAGRTIGDQAFQSAVRIHTSPWPTPGLPSEWLLDIPGTRLWKAIPRLGELPPGILEATSSQEDFNRSRT